MTIAKEDEKEILRVGQLLEKIESIDRAYLNKEYDVVYRQQPFVISLLLGYRIDLEELELEEMTKVILLIWEFFKNEQRIKQVKISEFQFERIHRRNIYMLKYFEGEIGEGAKMRLVSSDFENLRAKSLLTGVLAQFDLKAAFLDMKGETRGTVIIGLKSLIECFEEIIEK
jgi:hypothetical protein